jgi:hypothetical protein
MADLSEPNQAGFRPSLQCTSRFYNGSETTSKRQAAGGVQGNGLQLTIEKLVYGGDGLTRGTAGEQGPGKAVFLPFVLPGEQVEAQTLEREAIS